MTQVRVNEALIGGVLFLAVAIVGANGFFTGTGYAAQVGVGGSLLVTVVSLVFAITLLGRYFGFLK